MKTNCPQVKHSKNGSVVIYVMRNLYGDAKKGDTIIAVPKR